TPGKGAVLELPIAVATPLRLPLTGASLVLAPPLLRRAMLRSLEALDVVVINLHAMDLAEAELVPAPIRDRQPELRLPVRERLAILREAFAALAAGRTVATCEAVARAVTRTTAAP